MYILVCYSNKAIAQKSFGPLIWHFFAMLTAVLHYGKGQNLISFRTWIFLSHHSKKVKLVCNDMWVSKWWQNVPFKFVCIILWFNSYAFKTQTVEWIAFYSSFINHFCFFLNQGAQLLHIDMILEMAGFSKRKWSWGSDRITGITLTVMVLGIQSSWETFLEDFWIL